MHVQIDRQQRKGREESWVRNRSTTTLSISTLFIIVIEVIPMDYYQMTKVYQSTSGPKSCAVSVITNIKNQPEPLRDNNCTCPSLISPLLGLKST